MLDVETGLVLYKRPLLGSAAADVAAVDTDQDGYLDRIYSPTVGGFLYRVDLGLDSNGRAPALVDHVVTDVNGASHTVQCVPKLDGAAEPLWEPRIVFDANFDGSQATQTPRPFYQQPSVIFVAKLGIYAVAVGTGDREDLWSSTDQDGRFYIFVDDTDLLDPASLPLTEANLARVEPTDFQVTADFLLDRPSGQKGWFLALDPDERVITDAFALSGVSFFSTFQPDVQILEGKDPLCSKTGGSRIFIVGTTNGNAFLRDASDVLTRALEVANFVTEPYTEPGINKNLDGSGGSAGTADELTPQLLAVMEELKKLFPEECKFANYRVDIKTLSADTGVIFIAPVPVCLIEQNWKEF